MVKSELDLQFDMIRTVIKEGAQDYKKLSIGVTIQMSFFGSGIISVFSSVLILTFNF